MVWRANVVGWVWKVNAVECVEREGFGGRMLWNRDLCGRVMV